MKGPLFCAQALMLRRCGPAGQLSSERAPWAVTSEPSSRRAGSAAWTSWTARCSCPRTWSGTSRDMTRWAIPKCRQCTASSKSMPPGPRSWRYRKLRWRQPEYGSSSRTRISLSTPPATMPSCPPLAMVAGEMGKPLVSGALYRGGSVARVQRQVLDGGYSHQPQGGRGSRYPVIPAGGWARRVRNSRPGVLGPRSTTPPPHR